jgi:hypothetical protein
VHRDAPCVGGADDVADAVRVTLDRDRRDRQDAPGRKPAHDVADDLTDLVVVVEQLQHGDHGDGDRPGQIEPVTNLGRGEDRPGVAQVDIEVSQGSGAAGVPE